MRKIIILVSFIVILAVISGNLANASIPRDTYLKYMPPEILDAFDPSITKGERPSFHSIDNSDIWDLRKKPIFGVDWVRLEWNFDLHSLLPVQKEILISWVRNGGRLYVGAGPVTLGYGFGEPSKEVIIGLIKLFFPKVTVYEPVKPGTKVFLNEKHPISKDVKNFTVKWWRYALDNLPPESEVLVGADEKLTKGLLILFSYGRGKIFFHAPWDFDYSYDNLRFALNRAQWLIGEPVPDITLSEISQKQAAMEKKETIISGEEKEEIVSVCGFTPEIIVIEKTDDLKQVDFLKGENPPMVSIKAPRKIISRENLDTIRECVRKGGVVLIWAKPEYVTDEKLGFVGEYFGIYAKQSEVNKGDIVAKVTQRCIRCSLNKNVNKIMVSIPVYEKLGCSYESGFNYILAEREDEPIVVVKKQGKGYIVALPWDIYKDFFDGGIFWENITSFSRSPGIVGSMDVIELTDGRTVEALILDLSGYHLSLSDNDGRVMELLPINTVRRITTGDYLLAEKFRKRAPGVEIVISGEKE